MAEAAAASPPDLRRAAPRAAVCFGLVVVMAAAAVLAGTCGMQGGGTPQVGKMRHYSKSVDPKDAQPARAKLKMGAGQLKLASDPSGAALSTPQRHGGTPQASKRGD